MKATDFVRYYVCDGPVGLSAGFEDATCRYHVWLATEDDDRKVWITGGINTRSADPVLYKNSKAGHGQPGYFQTRHLDAGSKTWKPVIDFLMHYITEGGGLAAARAQKLAKAAEELRERKAEARRRAEKAALEGAAQVMLDVLRDIQHAWDTGVDAQSRWGHKVRAAIKRATTVPDDE